MAFGKNDAEYTIGVRDRTQRSLDSIKKNVAGVDKVVKGLGATAAVALGYQGLTGVLRNTVTATADSLDKIAKSAQRMGLSVQEFDAMTFAAEVSGVSVEQMGVAYRQAQKNIADTANGTGEARQTFEQLGISVTDASGRLKTATEVMAEVAGRFEEIDDQTRKAAAAQRIFGESGTILLTTLDKGKDAFSAMVAEGRAWSVVTEDMALRGENAKDAQLRLNRAMGATRDIVFSEVLPPLTSLAELLAGRMLKALTGVNLEQRKFLATLYDLGDAEFWYESQNEIESVSSEIVQQKLKVDQLEKSYSGLSRAITQPVAPGQAVGFQLDPDGGNLRKAREELAEMEKYLELLEERIDARVKRNRSRDAAAGDGPGSPNFPGSNDRLRAIEREITGLGYLRDEWLTASIEVPAGLEDWKAAVDRWRFELDNTPIALPLPDNFDGSSDDLTEQGESLGQDIGYAMAGGIGSAMDAVDLAGVRGAENFERAWLSAIGSVGDALWRHLVVDRLIGWLDKLSPAGAISSGLTAAPEIVSTGPQVQGGVTVIQQGGFLPAGYVGAVRIGDAFADATRAQGQVTVTRGAA